MPTDYVVKQVPAVRLAAVSATVDPAEIGQHVEPMFVRVQTALQSAGASLSTPMATYAEAEDGMDVVVGYAHEGTPPAGLEAVDLPSANAVCGVHLGLTDRIRESWQGLHRWLIDNGYEYDGAARELYVRAESMHQQDWVTELQQPVRLK
ncbi:GyrI-like domain-containing protein [Allobranchiibius sp. GilTou73]|uniref:GyrI-like domain-containing protein n=1 Tax=Allobranchiibius sp. GilTou73 TaxID=2904523 RepID=UPI001F41C9DC|nr:GyrI-like domain-containing protein [Allobranchiibius sp. GilTou73]UIJ35197.1 GyrI-like domain-containing protein [Allobranchiibius sp. GilTou73]